MSLPAEVAGAARRRTCLLVLGPVWLEAPADAEARLRALGLTVWNAAPEVTAPWTRVAQGVADDASVREALRGRTVLYAGFRPDRAPFADVHARLVRAWGGPLPRCHLAVAGPPPGDAVWQKWVWKGVLPFLSEPGALLHDLEEALA